MGESVRRGANSRHFVPRIILRFLGRTIQMWPNSWTIWPSCARTRANTKRWSTTTAAPWRSTSAGWARMIPTWPKPRTTWWDRSSRQRLERVPDVGPWFHYFRWILWYTVSSVSSSGVLLLETGQIQGGWDPVQRDSDPSSREGVWICGW